MEKVIIIILYWALMPGMVIFGFKYLPNGSRWFNLGNINQEVEKQERSFGSANIIRNWIRAGFRTWVTKTRLLISRKPPPPSKQLKLQLEAGSSCTRARACERPVPFPGLWRCLTEKNTFDPKIGRSVFVLVSLLFFFIYLFIFCSTRSAAASYKQAFPC